MSVDLTKPIGGAINITYGPYNGYIYFFHSDGTYSRFNRMTCELEYYASIMDNWKNWPANWPYPYAETSWADDHLFFFRNPNYVSFSMTADQVEGSEEPIQGKFRGWPTGWLDRVDAALYWGYHAGEKRRKAYFFRDDEYIRYDVDGNHIDEGYDPPGKIATYWPGWPTTTSWSQVWAAVDWGNGKVYFFTETEYLRYDKFLDRVDDGYPRPLSDFTKEHKDKLAEENQRLVFQDKAPASFIARVRTLAKKLDVRPNWIMASIWMESRFNPKEGENGGPYVGLHQVSLERIYNNWGRGHKDLSAKYPDLFHGQPFEQLTSDARLKLAKEFAALGFGQIDVIESWLTSALHDIRGKCRSFDQFRLVGFGGKGFAQVDRTMLDRKVAQFNVRYDLDSNGKIDVSEFREAVFHIVREPFQNDPAFDSELRHSLG